MLILIDGYNVIAPVAPPGRRAVGAGGGATGAGDRAASDWLHGERARLLQRLARRLDPVLAARTHVIFDAAGPSRRRPEAFRAQGIHVRFAVNHDQADDLIEELIAAHHFPKRLTVVSSDHRLQVAAARAGATAFDSQPWLDGLLDGELMLAIPWPPRPGPDVHEAQSLASQHNKPDRIGQRETEQWMREFGISSDEVQRLAAGEPDVEPGRAWPQRSAEQGGGPESGQGRGRGRAGDRAAEPPASQPKAGKGRRRPPKKNLPRNDPPPEDYNPFPKGYGEDLLP